MGIKDLLRFLKPYTEAVHIEKYGGKRVGIDAYSWLHKGAYSCSMEICLDSDGDAKLNYIRYFMHRIDMLRHYNVVPLVVFDGGNIACKSATEDERYRRRQANRELAMKKLKEGNISAATEFFQKAINITTSMAHQLIQTLRRENVEFMVAPYEADAQLAYLAKLGGEKGGIEAVITEDSDLLAYGCPTVIFKMDRYGNAEEILLEKVLNSTNCKPSFQKFNRDLFTGMCVLAGCDFLPSIPGIGIAKAHSLVSKYYNIERALSVLKFGKSYQMPEYYMKSFRQAVAVFQHARIYDKITKRIQHIKPLDEELVLALDGELDFLGSDLPPSIATAISEGILDPITMEAYNCSQNTSGHQPNPSFKKKTAPALASQAQSCFAVYSSTTKAEVPVQRQVLKELNYSNEAAQLAMIVEQKDLTNSCKKRKHDFPFHLENSVISLTCDEDRVKTPQNNPFKRCNTSNSGLSEISVIFDKTVMETPFKTHDQATSSDITFTTPDNNPFKIRRDQNASNLQEDDTLAELCWTEVEMDSSTVFSPVVDSQASVNSNVGKMQDSRRGNKGRTRLRRGGCKKLGDSSRKSTILDFFSY